jgi:hypothetical protein
VYHRLAWLLVSQYSMGLASGRERDIDIALPAGSRASGAVAEVLSKNVLSLCTPAVADVLPLLTVP